MKNPKPWFALPILLLLAAHSLSATCVDSVHFSVRPVQCYGLRDGILRVDSVFGGAAPFYYSIDGQTFSTNPLFERLWAGQYTLTVRDASGCARQWPLTVTEPEELKVQIFASESLLPAGKPFQLQAEYAPAEALVTFVEWQPAALFSASQQLSQTLRISESTLFSVEIRDKNGCSARHEWQVEVESPHLYFPNAIRPSGQTDGYFTLFSDESVARIASLQVYSRGGGLVFERQDFLPNDPLRGWGGRWRGKLVQPGVYPWVAVVEYLDGRQERHQGTVTVVH
jgi:hypothetical protein